MSDEGVSGYRGGIRHAVEVLDWYRLHRISGRGAAEKRALLKEIADALWQSREALEPPLDYNACFALCERRLQEIMRRSEAARG